MLLVKASTIGFPQNECFEGKKEQTNKRQVFAFGKLAIVRFATSGCGEMADALDLGSSGRPWGFKSLHPHQYGSIAQLDRASPF